MKKLLTAYLLLITFIPALTMGQLTTRATLTQYNSDAVVRELSENVFAEILPRVELLAGVLSHTSWMERMGPKGQGNVYFAELSKFFESYKNHEAVEIAEDLTEDGFSYDAPLSFILNRGPLPELMGNRYSKYLINRADGAGILEEFRQSLKNLSNESAFLKFFQSKKSLLSDVIDSTLKGFEAIKITNWLNNYFGYKGDEFHLVFAPSMFPGGGYGAGGEVDGKYIVYQVIRTDAKNTGIPVFPKRDYLAELTFHELGHSFVNPAFDEQSELMEEYDLEDLYDPVEEQMRKMAYPNLDTFFDEIHIRAVTILAMEDYADSLYDKQKYLKAEKEKGFYFIDYAYNKMKEYKENRTRYTSFKEWLPELIECYKRDKKYLLDLIE